MQSPFLCPELFDFGVGPYICKDRLNDGCAVLSCAIICHVHSHTTYLHFLLPPFSPLKMRMSISVADPFFRFTWSRVRIHRFDALSYLNRLLCPSVRPSACPYIRMYFQYYISSLNAYRFSEHLFFSNICVNVLLNKVANE